MPSDLVIAPCAKCGGSASLSAGYGKRPIGYIWAARIWCRECFAYVEVGELEENIDIYPDPDSIKDVIKQKAVEYWNNKPKPEVEMQKYREED